MAGFRSMQRQTAVPAAGRGAVPPSYVPDIAREGKIAYITGDAVNALGGDCGHPRARSGSGPRRREQRNLGPDGEWISRPLAKSESESESESG